MKGAPRVPQWARTLRQETLAVYFAARDPRTPWLARILALLVGAYALSPIDLIPDFVPVLGYVDDLIIVPLGLALIVWLVPADVMESAREKAQVASERPVSRGMATTIVIIWLLALGWLAVWGIQAARAQQLMRAEGAPRLALIQGLVTIRRRRSG